MGVCASSHTSRVAASYRDDGSDSSEEERTKWGTHRFYTEHEKVTIGVDQFQVLQHMGHGYVEEPAGVAGQDDQVRAPQDGGSTSSTSASASASASTRGPGAPPESPPRDGIAQTRLESNGSFHLVRTKAQAADRRLMLRSFRRRHLLGGSAARARQQVDSFARALRRQARVSKHPALLSLEHAFWDEENCYVVTEEHVGSLGGEETVSLLRGLPLEAIQAIVVEMSLALHHIHAAGVVHGSVGFHATVATAGGHVQVSLQPDAVTAINGCQRSIAESEGEEGEEEEQQQQQHGPEDEEHQRSKQKDETGAGARADWAGIGRAIMRLCPAMWPQGAAPAPWPADLPAEVASSASEHPLYALVCGLLGTTGADAGWETAGQCFSMVKSALPSYEWAEFEDPHLRALPPAPLDPGVLRQLEDQRLEMTRRLEERRIQDRLSPGASQKEAASLDLERSTARMLADSEGPRSADGSEGSDSFSEASYSADHDSGGESAEHHLEDDEDSGDDGDDFDDHVATLYAVEVHGLLPWEANDLLEAWDYNSGVASLDHLSLLVPGNKMQDFAAYDADKLRHKVEPMPSTGTGVGPVVASSGAASGASGRAEPLRPELAEMSRILSDAIGTRVRK